MKIQILFSLFIILFVGCKKEKTNDTDPSNYGISFIGSSFPKSFGRVNLANGTFTTIENIDKYEGLCYSPRNARSINKNLYIYDIDPLTVGIIDLSSFNLSKIDLSMDSTISGIESFSVDELSNLLYIVTGTRTINNQHFISLIPIDLNNNTIHQKINVIQQTDTIYYGFLSSMDYKGKRIFIKPISSSKVYIYYLAQNNIETRSTTAHFYDLNYNEAENSIFGLTDNLDSVFCLSAFSLNDYKTNIIGKLPYIFSLMNRSLFYNRIDKSYWIVEVHYETHEVFDLLKIDITNANIIQRNSLPNLIQKIN